MNYSSLLVEETYETVVQRIKDAAAAKGAQPDSWRDRSTAAVLTAALATVLLYLYQLVRFFAGGAAFSADTEGSLAKQWAYSQFGLTQREASPAVFEVTLSCEVGQGPYDLDSNFKLSTTWGAEFFLVTAFTLESGASTLVEFQAVDAGTAGNVSPAALSIIVSPLAGVSAAPEQLATSGADAETVAELFTRCQLRWAGIGGASSEFVQNLALEVDPLLTKVKTRVDSTGVGVMIIYAGQLADTASGEQVSMLATRVAELQLFQAVSVSVEAAAPEQYVITGTVTVFPGRKVEAQEAVSEAVSVWQVLLGYGDTIRASDVWRRLFASDAINYVDLTVDSVYTVDAWSLTVLQNSLVFVDPAEF